MLVGALEQVQLKIDSKGRLCISPQLRQQLGDTVILKKTPEGYLIIPGKQTNFLDEFKKIIVSEPKRTGKPENWSPEKMKEIWGST
jgi:DNA-binding transcriptional regulator/RsmH inhibitor MraZ